MARDIRTQRSYHHGRRDITCLFLMILLAAAAALADTKGKLTGKVIDQRTKEPLMGVNVTLLGTTIGASTDPDGGFIILNIPSGSYRVRFSMIGYGTKLVNEVDVSAGQTTTLNETLTEEALQTSEVTVTATKPIVDTRQTSSVKILDSKQFNALPVQDLNDIVNLQAGVVGGHFRGGRLGEVQYQVDGVSINNPYDNSASVQLDRSVLREVQVISGTFDAEYGQAMSGVVNAVLRSGSVDHFEANAEVYTGTYSAPSSRFPDIGQLSLTSIRSYQASVSGPTPIPKTTFLLSVRRFTDGGYLFGVRRFEPTDKNDLESMAFHPTGDSAIVPMDAEQEWSGQGKISTTLLPNIQLSYQAVYSSSEHRPYNYAWRLNPDGLATKRSTSLVHGVDLTQALSPLVYYTISLRQNLFDYKDLKYESVYDPMYWTAGKPIGTNNYNLGAIVQGVDLGRFIQETNSYVVKASVTSQVDKTNLVKVGVEAQKSEIKFGSPGALVETVVNGVQTLVARVDDPLYPHVVKSTPIWLSAYAQDRLEFKDILLRGGVRFEMFDADAKVPSDLANPANAISGAPESHPQATKVKMAVAPRLGISYPITDQSSVFFSYGHFYQYPGIGNIFSNSDYSILKDLQAGGISYGVMGNPDLKPEFTTQYEVGYKGALTENFGVDVSAFYKDIRDLLGIEFVSTYAAAQYARFTNVDFGTVNGVSFSLDYRLSVLTVSVDYTYQTALGNSSDPSETANRAAAGEDPRPRKVPLNWDQRNTLNVIIGARQEGNYSGTVIVRYADGQPYTPIVGSGFNAELERNSGRKPSSVTVDLRVEKTLALLGAKFNIFARVSNLFGAHFSNGFVFPSTGSADYTLNPAGEQTTLNDPSRFSAPRRIEVGLSLASVTW